MGAWTESPMVWAPQATRLFGLVLPRGRHSMLDGVKGSEMEETRGPPSRECCWYQEMVMENVSELDQD